MKNIFSILKYDLKNVARNIIVFVVIIGIAILPALYSWFNIASNWDPYSNTGALNFAVSSLDKGYNYKALKINAGDSITDNLKQNNKMGWKFVNKKTALQGVKDGKYYAAVVIPENFSKSLFSITTGKFNQAKVQYYVNEKINAIAPKITAKGAEAIEESVNKTYVDKITEVIATALNMTGTEISDYKADAADKIIKHLKNTKVDLNEFSKTNALFISTLDSINNLLESNKDLEPAIRSAINKAGAVGSDVKNTLKGFSSTSSQISDSIASIINQGSGYSQDIDDELSAAFNDLGKDSDSAADRLSRITSINNKIISINNTAISVLNKIHTIFPDIKTDKLINLLNKSNNKQNNIINKINKACDTIRKTGNLPKNVQNELKSEIASAKKGLSNAKASFSDIKGKLDKAADDVYSALDDVSEFVTSLGSGTGTVKKLLNNGIKTVDNLKATFVNLNGLLKNANTKIDTLINKVEDIKKNKKVDDLITPIIANPEELGKFISSPVTIKENRVYPVENYGSAMTPFYTSLGLWVGGVVLVAVINVNLSKRELKSLNKPKNYQIYFGRYLIFFIMAEIQGLVIALGDILFLKVQCDDPWLFILASLISSFVYSLIIYSLTITFSVLGKALAVIILVLQVAGSGGTFPIEVLPEPFRVMSPFLPFKYGISALRETVAGVNFANYWMNLGYLLLFAVVALLIGLVLRKPCIKVVNFFNERVEESELVV